jgi:hypothetical protein
MSDLRRFTIAIVADSDFADRHAEEWEGIACVVLRVYDDRWTNICIPSQVGRSDK